MKKLALFSFLLALGLASCKKENTTTPSSFPTDNLVVDKQQNVFAMDKTGAWCQFCPRGTELMVQANTMYGDRFIGFAAHGGSGNDPLKNPTADLFINNFAPNEGFPALVVMNEVTAEGDFLQNIAAAMNLPELPTFGVKHNVVNTDSGFTVYAKVECLNESLNDSYFIQSFLLLDEVDGKDFGNGLDLNQVSSIPFVSTGSGATPTKWVLDAAVVDGEPQKKAGDIFTHDEAVVAVGTNTPTFWGLPLGEINPFNNEFLEGDVLGTKYTPIIINIADGQFNYAPFNPKLSVATIVWKYNADGSETYDFVNGYVSHLSSN